MRLKTTTYLLAAAAVILSCSGRTPEEKKFPWRWVFLFGKPLENDRQVEEIRQIAKTAAEHELNGMVLSAGLDNLDRKDGAFFPRLEEVKKICAETGLELIPIIFSPGYGGTALSHNKNLAEGLPVKDALFVASGDEAALVEDPPVEFVNGGLEKSDDKGVQGFELLCPPGVAVLDYEVKTEGEAALRFENLGSMGKNPGAVSQKVRVHPNRCYRISFKVKTQGLDYVHTFGSSRFRAYVRGLPDRRDLQFYNPPVPPTGDWQDVSVGFNSDRYEEVEINIGVWGCREGKFWLDDIRIEEVGLLNVLRRPGTPVTVRGEKSGTIYEEGRDYARIEDPNLNHRFDHHGPPIVILPESRIADGERLRISWFHSMTVYWSQISVCMSEPEFYKIYRESLARLHKHLSPKKYLLAVDEIRTANSCQACAERGLSNGELIGDCITRLCEMIKETNPEAEVLLWSDMFDPHHNAGHRDYYYHVDGDFYGAWNYIPEDLVIAVWGREPRPQSFEHFASLGYRTFGCCYYDTEDLEHVKGWLRDLDATKGALGAMYTTWREKYELLDEFGELMANYPASVADQ